MVFFNAHTKNLNLFLLVAEETFLKVFKILAINYMISLFFRCLMVKLKLNPWDMGKN